MFLSARGSLASGSNPYWGEDDVTLTSTTQLSSLRVAVHVTQTGGVASTGDWSSIGDKLDVQVTSDGSGVTYLFTLKPGVTLNPGTYTFAAQYKHSGNRSSHNDSYDGTGAEASSGTVQGVRGSF